MKQLLLIVPLAAALGLSACNMNNEVEPDIMLEESPSAGLENVDGDAVMQEDDTLMEATPSPTGMMDDEASVEVEGDVDAEL